jgi:acetyl/propionyl-CoA carboxylase alpha subunit
VVSARTAAGPLRVLFIANRGEIAARIERTCRRLGIDAVLPHRDVDPGLDLLDPAAVVGAALQVGADALHPGYGFLSEQAAFAEAVLAAGLRWVGPPPDAIRAMGDKAGARRLAASLGIPVLPGYDGDDQSDATLLEEAVRIGLPVLVKPAGGGGGKGMHIVRGPAELGAAVAAARREAQTAFGDERLLLERHVAPARHVEIQLLADGFGAAIHLGERDCSVQRRFQKVLEEAPGPTVHGSLREALATAALRLAAAVGYTSAGTCEFLVDDSGAWWFLEMNTRLQVEHPVTELVTGRDLVADQLRIAVGERLGIAQRDVELAGHAVEVRLYAEDPAAGFLPATGRVEAIRWPRGPHVRVEPGIAVGDEVTGRFDPLLAKIAVWGRGRDEALGRLADALDATRVLGLTTNLRFLRWLVRSPLVREGVARTDTLERYWPPPEDWGPPHIPEAAWQLAARLLLEEAAATRAGDPWRGGWRLNAPPAVRLRCGTDERMVRLPARDVGRPHGDPVPDVPCILADGTVHLDLAGCSVPCRIAPAPEVDLAARQAAQRGPGSGSEVAAPMPGRVLAVHVAESSAVASGDPIATLEAMKMEQVVTAPRPGIVTDLLVRPGDQVSGGQLLAVIGAQGGATADDGHGAGRDARGSATSDGRVIGSGRPTRAARRATGRER